MAALIEALLYYFLLVLLCGDVKQNPGLSTKYPCSLCCQPLCRNQKALFVTFVKNGHIVSVVVLIITPMLLIGRWNVFLGAVHIVWWVLCRFMTAQS